MRIKKIYKPKDLYSFKSRTILMVGGVRKAKRFFKARKREFKITKLNNGAVLIHFGKYRYYATGKKININSLKYNKFKRVIEI